MTKVDWKTYNGWYIIYKNRREATHKDLDTGELVVTPAILLDMDLTIEEFLQHWNTAAVNDNSGVVIGIV